MQGVETAWADDPPVCPAYLKTVWSNLRHVQDDLFHWLQWLLERIPAGHSAKGMLAMACAPALVHDHTAASHLGHSATQSLHAELPFCNPANVLPYM